MRLLITNDDGVYAPGLLALHQALAQDHQVQVVAPETEQSCVGHALTVADPIRVRTLGPRTGMQGWAVAGTPADCVKLALAELLEQPPHMVVSGINLGSNVGVNLLYSGTVSAASEAAIYHLPAMAVSLDTRGQADFTYAARVAAHLVGLHPALGLPPTVPLNVNVPALPPEQIRGVRVVPQSLGRVQERFVRRQDPRGGIYYWQDGEIMRFEDGQTDHGALMEGYVTITPVRHDLTHHQALNSLRQGQFDLPPGD